MEIQIHEAQRTPNRLNLNKATLRHITIKLSIVKDKERILRVSREKREVTYKGIFIRLLTDLWTETFEARREWDDRFKIPKKEKSQPSILYLKKLFFINGKG